MKQESDKLMKQFAENGPSTSPSQPQMTRPERVQAPPPPSQQQQQTDNEKTEGKKNNSETEGGGGVGSGSSEGFLV